MKYSHMLNDYTSLNITKLDILDELETIKVGVGYELDGSPLYTMPASLKELGRVKVVYKELKGWQSDITSCVAWD